MVKEAMSLATSHPHQILRDPPFSPFSILEAHLHLSLADKGLLCCWVVKR